MLVISTFLFLSNISAILGDIQTVLRNFLFAFASHPAALDNLYFWLNEAYAYNIILQSNILDDKEEEVQPLTELKIIQYMSQVYLQFTFIA